MFCCSFLYIWYFVWSLSFCRSNLPDFATGWIRLNKTAWKKTCNSFQLKDLNADEKQSSLNCSNSTGQPKSFEGSVVRNNEGPNEYHPILCSIFFISSGQLSCTRLRNYFEPFAPRKKVCGLWNWDFIKLHKRRYFCMPPYELRLIISVC